MDPEKRKEIDIVTEELKQLKKDQEDILVKISNTSCRLRALKQNAYTPSEMLLAEALAKVEFYEGCFGHMRKELIENGVDNEWVDWDGQPKVFRDNQIRKQLEKMDDTEVKI